jgi:hypothetical protein
MLSVYDITYENEELAVLVDLFFNTEIIVMVHLSMSL